MAALVCVSTHAPPHSVWPAAHWQLPATQLCPATHARLHAPQLAALVSKFTHAPLHRLVPAGHTHAPPEHICPAGHARPQAPQLVALFCVSTSQPLATTISQSAKPALQATKLHALIAHPATALANGPQARPQAPQFCGDVLKLTSHPLASTPSQLPKPALHGPITQLPPRQLGLEFGAAAQRALHEPQFTGSTSVLTSQPSLGFMLQSASGRTQLPTPHTPALHVGPPPAGTGHTLPQRPQLLREVLRLTSQPLTGLPSQSANPGLHLANRHAPSAQSLTALAKLQTRPHMPQLLASPRMLTSHPSIKLRLQSAKPALQVPPHMPPTQVALPLATIGHIRPHIPQLLVSVVRLVSQPSPTLLLQSPNPGPHIAMVHAPPTHAALPLTDMHAFAQRPQLAALVRRSTSQPSAGLLLQSAKLGLQVNPHILIVHVAVALGGLGQGFPQRPQLVTSVRRSVSQPLAAFMSQSPKPPEQRPTAQRPIVQEGSALGTMHTVPHAPQLAVLFCVSTHASMQHCSPPGHACPAVQPITQRLPRHTWPAGQCMSVTHGTHVCVIGLQCGVSPMHASSREQPGAHCIVTGSQNSVGLHWSLFWQAPVDGPSITEASIIAFGGPPRIELPTVHPLTVAVRTNMSSARARALKHKGVKFCQRIGGTFALKVPSKPQNKLCQRSLKRRNISAHSAGAQPPARGHSTENAQRVAG